LVDHDPLEPYLLTKEAGPFMVMARPFRGPGSEQQALALVLELRRDYNLPAYILRLKDFPRNSNIWGVPPTAERAAARSRLTPPEKFRSTDEAVVLVGNEKTLKGSEVLLHKVKKIKPKCLENMKESHSWGEALGRTFVREGLKQAIRTTNPFVPVQDIFPGKQDPLIAQMNQGPRSIFNCPGRYSLQIAEFTGRSKIFSGSAALNIDMNQSLGGSQALGRSPLATAAEDAERLASKISKDPMVKTTGQQAYVYHDRTSSKVLIGSFNSPTDPNAAALRDNLLRQASALSSPEKTGMVIVPATQLTDLGSIKPN
ncbi:hypothetical protein ACYOEI_32645, partial [Singulisphaera rosea]